MRGSVELAPDGRQTVLHAAAKLLAENHFAEVSMERVASSAGIPIAAAREHFSSMHELASCILDAEGKSMRGAQEHASAETKNPLGRLRATFRRVGQNMAGDVFVRAGMRLASESHRSFPERKIDPFRTWQFYISAELEQARSEGLLVDNVDVPTVAWMLVAAGLGTKELVVFRDAWHEVGPRLEATLDAILTIISMDSPETVALT